MVCQLFQILIKVKGRVSVGRQEIFPLTSTDACEPKGGSSAVGKEKHHFPFCFFQTQGLFT